MGIPGIPGISHGKHCKHDEMPLESQLLRSVERHLKALARQDPGFVWRKRHGSPFAVAGDPDLYGLWNGLHFEIELKRPGESPTLLQSARLNAWAKAGAHCFVVHTLAELEDALDTIQRRRPGSLAPPQGGL